MTDTPTRAAELAHRSRREQGLPPTIEDQTTLERLAGLFVEVHAIKEGPP